MNERDEALELISDLKMELGLPMDQREPRASSASLSFTIEELEAWLADGRPDRLRRISRSVIDTWSLTSRLSDRVVSFKREMSARPDLAEQTVEVAGRTPLDVVGEVGRRLVGAIEETMEGIGQVLGGALQPATTLGDADTGDLRPVSVALPDATLGSLGEDVQARAVIGDGLLRVTLARVSELDPGDVVTLAALAPEGELRRSAAVGESGSERLRFELEWTDADPPSEIAFIVTQP